MNFLSDANFVKSVLEPSFPRTDGIKIIKNSVGIKNQQYFTSEIVFLSIEYVENGATKKRDLAVKFPKNTNPQSFFHKHGHYQKEIRVYQEMLPRMNTFLDKPLNPAHYYTTAGQALVLEDLHSLGFECLSERQLSNLQLYRPVFQALAHFHAASYKLHKLHPHILSDDIFQNTVFVSYIKNWTSSWEPYFYELLGRKKEFLLIPRVKKVIDFLKMEEAKIPALFHKSKFKFAVLNHGDFRNDNLLLKYGGDEAAEAKILDFQVVFWSSPIWDIFYFLTLSAPIDLVRAHFHTLIEWYLKFLNEKLSQLNCEIVYEKDDFARDSNNLKFLFILHLMCWCTTRCPLGQGQKEETFQLEAGKSGSTELCLNDEKFTHDTIGWLKFYEKLGVFDDKLIVHNV